MLLLDVNILLATHRTDHPHHVPVRGWFDDLLKGDDAFAVPTLIWGSFLRLATNRRIFSVPTPLTEAFAFVNTVSSQPHHVLLTAGSRHLALIERVCVEAGAVGDLVPDAVVGAVALEHDCEVVTLDRDFARFPSVRHRLLPLG